MFQRWEDEDAGNSQEEKPGPWGHRTLGFVPRATPDLLCGLEEVLALSEPPQSRCGNGGKSTLPPICCEDPCVVAAGVTDEALHVSGQSL